MKSTSELTDFYYKDLYPSLNKLEKERKQIASKLKLYGFMGGIIVLITMPIFGFFFSITLGAIVATSIYYYMTVGYVKTFKTQIITRIIHEISPNLRYDPDGMISPHLLQRSGLLQQSIDRFNGNDYVKGDINGVLLQFSDAHAEYKTKDNEWHTAFEGLFVVAEFNKHFKSKTLILPDQAQKHFGTLIGQWLQSNNLKRDALIKLDDPEFEKMFVVYGNDPIETRYILTNSMMKRLISFQKKLSHPLLISFARDHIHVGIRSGKDLFEPTVFSSLLDYKQAIEYVNTLQNTIGLVEELKLNDKLWSKK